MGGTRGWGPVRPPRRDEPVFEESWEKGWPAIDL
ncbi:hypothetical protein ACWEQH_19600 [Streptomyces sp. NPDC004166]